MTSEATYRPDRAEADDRPEAHDRPEAEDRSRTEDRPHAVDRPQGVDGQPDKQGRVEVRLVSEDPAAARRVADALRLLFSGGEQRSYPAGVTGTGARLHLTLDASRAAGPLRSWLDSSRPPADRTHQGETAS
ncbi:MULTISPECIES: hypothetical protein [Streptomyces]|nr:hypothetical protein [Streptomyces avermitilis]BBJ52462.1 hypothetical protein SAVMC3_50910 [Streptomyces avermitilis]GDY64500.1 hypothetical protein SAV14893_038930 [Streptomyces avermitilis]GDY75328.1 hypothetical protein SAV31267_048130 [Streptomyces avermitilis]GDY84330.1 hypothetical protein SAVCW2_35290 [Streptomyces avermitilis]